MSKMKIFALVLVLAASSITHAADWPQWRGPERTAISSETGLLKSWPADGPTLLWKKLDMGGGYCTPSVANGRIYGMSYRGEDEVIWALDEITGTELWSTRIAQANKRVGYGEGPRCTPTIEGQKLFAIGVSGDLVCLDADTGKEIWRQNFVKDFGGSIPNWGYTESPLIEGNMLIATPGGKEATIVAFDKRTGRTIWTSDDPDFAEMAREEKPPAEEKNTNRRRRRQRGPTDFEGAGYASPIAFTVGDVRQVATFTSKGGIGVRAKDGEFLWRNNKPANPTANCATPVFHNDHIFFTSDYGTGCALVKLNSDGTSNEVYFNRDMRNHHGGVIRLGDYLYGFSSNILTCMKMADGSVAWKDRSVGKGSLCFADGRLYVLSENGVMGLVEATPEAYREISRFKIPDRSRQHSWSHPVVANGRLLIRDQNTLLCYDVSDRQASTE